MVYLEPKRTKWFLASIGGPEGHRHHRLSTAARHGEKPPEIHADVETIHHPADHAFPPHIVCCAWLRSIRPTPLSTVDSRLSGLPVVKTVNWILILPRHVHQ